MTSEVVIMNRHAVALAADSAVTVTTTVGGNRERRYFKGVNKVFELSHHQPVGIMIFDVADIHSVPWEVVIKMYRDSLGRNAFPTLEEYAKGLFSFVENHSSLISRDHRDELLSREAFFAAVMTLSDIESNPRVKQQSDVAQRDAERDIVIQEIEQKVTALPLSSHFPSTALSDASAKVAPKLTEALTSIMTSRGLALDAGKVARVAIEALFKDYSRYLSHTGIVVAGYGENDCFPSFIQYDTYGLSLGAFIADKKESKAVSFDDGSHIQTFAQDDMVFTFMAGISPDIYYGVQRNARQSLENLANAIVSAAGVSSLPNRADLVDAEFTKLKDSLVRLQVEKHYNPLTRVVASLPVDEMANLAETLIMLESLKERVTTPSESVAGPIDVALITRSEGLVWIRRKHYFEAALNGRFLERQRQRMV